MKSKENLAAHHYIIDIIKILWDAGYGMAANEIRKKLYGPFREWSDRMPLGQWTKLRVALEITNAVYTYGRTRGKRYMLAPLGMAIAIHTIAPDIFKEEIVPAINRAAERLGKRPMPVVEDT